MMRKKTQRITILLSSSMMKLNADRFWTIMTPPHTAGSTQKKIPVVILTTLTEYT